MGCVSTPRVDSLLAAGEFIIFCLLVFVNLAKYLSVTVVSPPETSLLIEKLYLFAGLSSTLHSSSRRLIISQAGIYLLRVSASSVNSSIDSHPFHLS